MSRNGLEEEEGSYGEEICSDREYMKMQTEFQTCSHVISSEVYNHLNSLTGREMDR